MLLGRSKAARHSRVTAYSEVVLKMADLGAHPRRSGGPEPLLHVVVAYQACLLCHYAATREHHKIGYATNIEAPGKLRVFFRVDF